MLKKLIHKHKTKNKIKVYGIFPFNPAFSEQLKNNPHAVNPDKPVSFTSTHEEALSVISRIVFLRHYSHYSLWCKFRKLPIGFTESSWTEYAKTLFGDDGEVLDPEDAFTVEELYYTPANFAAFLRMFTECEPLVLPHELPDELTAYLFNNDAAANGLTPHAQKLYDCDPDAKKAIEASLKSISKDVNLEPKEKFDA